MGSDVTPVLLSSLVAASVYAADPPRGPDSHDLKRERGDELMVDGKPLAPDPTGDGRDAAADGDRADERLRPGQRLSPAFLGGRHAIADPARHGLPPAAPRTRWIRHGDDAVLVDLRCRKVVRIEAGGLR